MILLIYYYKPKLIIWLDVRFDFSLTDIVHNLYMYAIGNRSLDFTVHFYSNQLFLSASDHVYKYCNVIEKLFKLSG